MSQFLFCRTCNAPSRFFSFCCLLKCIRRKEKVEHLKNNSAVVGSLPCICTLWDAIAGAWKPMIWSLQMAQQSVLRTKIKWNRDHTFKSPVPVPLRAACVLPFIPTDWLWGCSKAFWVISPPRRVTETTTPLVFSHQGLEVLSALTQFFPTDLVATHLRPQLLTGQEQRPTVNCTGLHGCSCGSWYAGWSLVPRCQRRKEKLVLEQWASTQWS